MTPTEIAKKMTPAQVRALRDLRKFHGKNYSECSDADWVALVSAEIKPKVVDWNDDAHRTEITPLGRALPLPGDPLAAALRLPEIKAVVEAGRQIRQRCGPLAPDGKAWDAAKSALEGKQ